MRFLWMILFLLVALGAYPKDPIVGIYGDIHGNSADNAIALDQMKKLGVTHIIATGDFLEWGGVAEATKILKEISGRTGVAKENIHLMPGNWDNRALQDSMVDTLSQYGKVICTNCFDSGYVTIQGRKIMVSHFPQHKIPAEMISPGSERYVRGVHAEENAAFGVFAHTHIGGYFVDPVSKKLIINPGTIHDRKRVGTEPKAFAVYDFASENISFYEVGREAPLDTVSTKVPPSAVPTKLDGCAKLIKDVIRN